MKPKIKKSELRHRERLLLRLITEWDFAGRCRLDVQVIRLWSDLGMPFITVGRERFFDPQSVGMWFEVVNPATGQRNIDTLWAHTPHELLPRTIEMDGAEFWLVPMPISGGGDDA
ncbi:MAG TPA: hypothetical protein VMW24_13105 [Sedimentisphaerales bacterium]|nr:hypothetical protein [Sedimentisphaerales bacterium]